jgi:alkylation response protein AidB-like acyl-CoA dehydrogenase
MKAQDTSELFFENIRIPHQHARARGKGFALMMTKLSQERLAQAIRSATVVETVLTGPLNTTSDRSVFGQKLANFQNTQFKLADLKTKATVARVFYRSMHFAFHGRKARSGRCRYGQDVHFRNFIARRSTNACNCSAAGAI